MAYDIKSKKMQFYSFFKMTESDHNGVKYLASENDCGLSKYVVEHCSSNSVFDHIKQKHIPMDSFEDIDLNF
jgi:hypothetical protein